MTEVFMCIFANTSIATGAIPLKLCTDSDSQTHFPSYKNQTPATTHHPALAEQVAAHPHGLHQQRIQGGLKGLKTYSPMLLFIVMLNKKQLPMYACTQVCICVFIYYSIHLPLYNGNNILCVDVTRLSPAI